MLFNSSSRISCKQNPEQVRAALVGKHLSIKELDFEFKESDGMLKVIPHTENDDKARIVPITHVEPSADGSGSRILVSSKPRKIDLGALYMVTGFIIVIAIIAVYLKVTYPEQTLKAPILVAAASLLLFIIFRIRLQSSYYGYIYSIRAFIKKELG